MANEKRLIDANTLKAKAFADPDSGEAMVYLQDIDEARTVDAVEVVHGRWIDRPTGRCGQWQAWCSACDKKCGCGGTLETQHKIFCPNCGARMDRGIDNG